MRYLLQVAAVEPDPQHLHQLRPLAELLPELVPQAMPGLILVELTRLMQR